MISTERNAASFWHRWESQSILPLTASVILRVGANC